MSRRTRAVEHRTTDRVLSDGLRHRDIDVLETVYRLHGRVCYSVARRLLGDARHSEDVVQEVFLLLWQHPHRYDPERGALRTWLLTVTHHKAVDKLRASGSRARAEGRSMRLDVPA